MSLVIYLPVRLAVFLLYGNECADGKSHLRTCVQATTDRQESGSPGKLVGTEIHAVTNKDMTMLLKPLTLMVKRKGDPEQLS